MRPHALASRLAWVQTSLTVAALAAVALAAAFGFRALLLQRADEQLQGKLQRMAYYVDQLDPAQPDWQWLQREAEEVHEPDARVLVVAPDGVERAAVGPELDALLGQPGCSSHGEVRSCSMSHRGYRLSVARNRSDDLALSRQVDLALLLLCAAGGLLVAASSRAIARRAALPLSELATGVAALNPGSGNRLRLDSNILEVKDLAERFDDLVERFEDALAREKRFSAEASHELRTPLTIARAEIEALGRDEQFAPAVSRALSAIDRLGALTEALLWFARAQGRLDEEQMDVVNLADLARSSLAELERLNAVRRIEHDLPDEALVRGDEGLLLRAVANLLENAAKHGDGHVLRVSSRQEGTRVVLEVINGGIDIPAELREQIFLPFVRGSRTGRSTGFGLGLPLARAVARAHGGDIIVGTAPAGRVAMELRLPLLAWHAGAPVASVAQ